MAENRKSLLTLALMSMMLLSAAAVFAVSGDAPHIFVIVLAGLIGSFAVRRPLPRTSRTFIYAGLLALTTVVLVEQIMPVEPRRFFLMPAELYCPAILFLGVAATYFDHRDSNVTGVVAMSIIAMMLAGNVVGFFDSFQRLPFSPLHMEFFHLFFAAMVALQMIAMVLLLPRIQNIPGGWERKGRYRLRRILVGVSALVLVAGTVWGLRLTATYYERRYQNLFGDLFQKYLYRHSRRVVFGRDVDLWRTVPLRRDSDKRIVLRAICSQAPGYLRGQAYTLYLRGRWSGTALSDTLLMYPPEGHLAYSTFSRRLPPSVSEMPPVPRRVDILPSRDFRSDVLLVPGTANRFELVAAGVSHSVDGVLMPDEWEQETGYAFSELRTTTDTAYAFPILDAADREQYLNVSLNLREGLDQIAAEVFPDRSGALPGRLAIACLSRYFARDFEYRLGTEWRDDGGDPILQFLRETRAGHCELFATAAVLLLRRAGIPARYVTGFVCQERNPNGGYWIARLEDAHAWAEAYLEEERRWVTVEMTPAAGRPDAVEEYSMITGFGDRLRTVWKRLFSLLKWGYVAEAIVQSLRKVFQFTGLALTSPLIGIGILLILGGCGYVLRIYVFRRSLPADPCLSRERRELLVSFRRLERYLAKRGIVRRNQTTVAEFATELKTSAELGVFGEEAGNLLLQYQGIRFAGPEPESQAVARFHEQVARITRPRLFRGQGMRPAARLTRSNEK